MNEGGKRDQLSQLFKMRVAMIEAGTAETNEAAWLRHLTTHPEDLYANIRIFNRPKQI